MRTFVLGAGASHHAGYPLTRDLGKALLEWIRVHPDSFQDWRHALDVLERAETEGALGDLEGLLEATHPERPAFGTALMAGVELLFRDLRAEEPPHAYEAFSTHGVCAGDVVVTFNYDDAVERALQRAGKWAVGDGYGFGVLPQPEHRARVPVLKLHGSINWWAALFEGRTSGFSAVALPALGLRPVIPDYHFQALGCPELRDPKCPKQTVRLQVMVPPYRRKQFFFDTSFGPEFDSFYDTLWDQAEAALRGSQEVFILGYSLPFADERAAELLLGGALTEARVTVASGASSEGIVQRLHDSGVSHVRAVADRFEDLDWSLPRFKMEGRSRGATNRFI